MAQCEADVLAVAGIIYAVVLNAFGIACDATDVVGSRHIAKTADGHVLACTDGVGLLALVGRQVGGGEKEAVGDGRLVGGVPAGEGVVKHACVHAAWLHQRVGDDRSVIYRPADESAAVGSVGCLGKGAVEQAAVNGNAVAASAQRADQSAVGAVAADATVNGNRAAAIGDIQISMRLAHYAAGKLSAGVNGTIHMQILDGGILDVTERSCPVL